ncbi:Unknown protein, partial [Striga hermonthica]
PVLRATRAPQPRQKNLFPASRRGEPRAAACPILHAALVPQCRQRVCLSGIAPRHASRRGETSPKRREGVISRQFISMTLEFGIFRDDSRIPQGSRQYLSTIFGDSSRDLCVLVISQNFITCSIILNFLNVQMPPRREPDHPTPTQATVVAQFRDYHAEKFSGQGDPRIVDEWIQGLEFIFEVMDCPDRYRVICAQLQLTGDARLWWNAYWSMRPGEKAGCTWEMLK